MDRRSSVICILMWKTRPMTEEKRCSAAEVWNEGEPLAADAWPRPVAGRWISTYPPLNFLYETGVAWGSYKSVFPYGFCAAPWGRKRSICSQAICFVENSVFQGHFGQLVVFSEFFNFLDKKNKKPFCRRFELPKKHFVEDVNHRVL